LYVDIIIAYMKDKKSREHLSRLRQKVLQSRQMRRKYIENLLHPKPMIIGSLYEVYKTCGKPNCSCKKGKRHGPFPMLSVSIREAEHKDGKKGRPACGQRESRGISIISTGAGESEKAQQSNRYLA
jgi:hypothetical protein